MSEMHVDQLRQLAKRPPATSRMPPHLQRLHKRVMAHMQQERAGRRLVVDTEGRSWGPAPGAHKHRSDT